MNTNQQTPIISTTKEQNKLVEMTQGGCLSRIYRNYSFEPVHEKMSELHEPDTVNEYLDIVKEMLSAISKDRVILISSQWKKTRMAKEDFFSGWTPPIFIEDGKMQQLKQELKDGKWGEQHWADYMWYEQRMTKSIFLRIPSEIRYYHRDIYILQEKLDIPLLDRMGECSFEISAGVGIRVFPHSKIEHLENDKETIRNYIHRDDFIIQIAFDQDMAFIGLELNHNYMNFEQMLEIIEPLFEKRGIKIKDKTDPYIYANYPPDAIEYNEHPCAGYEFIE